MYKHLWIVLVFILSAVFVYGQKTIEGEIFSQTTKEPIPYANIGVKNSNVGTISNFDGTFSILIPQRLNNDTLTFTSLGFFKKTMAVNQLDSKKNYTILLDEKATLLKPIVITAKKLKDKTVIFGNRNYTAGNYEPDTVYSGRSVALLIDIKNLPKQSALPIYLKRASLAIFRNNFDLFRFRVRLNKYDSLTGKPGEDLIEKSIVVESNWKTGWINFELSDLNFQVTGPFFVTFEQLLDLNDRTAIAYGYRRIIRAHPEWLKTDTVFYGGKKQITQRLLMGGIDLPGTFIGASYAKAALDKYSCFVRETSLGEWKKVPMIIAATVTVSGQFKASNKPVPDIPLPIY